MWLLCQINKPRKIMLHLLQQWLHVSILSEYSDYFWDTKKVKPWNIENTKQETMKCQTTKVKPRNIKPQNIKPRNIQPQNVKPRNVKHTKQETMERQTTKSWTMKRRTMKRWTMKGQIIFCFVFITFNLTIYFYWVTLERVIFYLCVW